ncbi:DUF3500 domain-containing protein [Deinococcus pimensis]|uniref:DUF3500 domain-containing protein n=1 Tax=Deinococcus pimensis TaxID=309888 RepID=UPI000488ED42|nr:DUF3500 domain-containing protein [Deinococcus pimensis]
MKLKFVLPVLLLTACLGACGGTSASTDTTTTDPGTTVTTPDTSGGTTGPAVKSAADAQTDRIVDAANAFLATLTTAQKTAVQYAWTDSAQRAGWSNFPTGIFQRAGVRWGGLTSTQRAALTTLLGAVLSEDGLKNVQEQMTADDVLKSQGGGNLTFGSDEYYVAFLGTPSTTTGWTLQFGGHHLALNATVAGANVTLAHSLTGGQPVRYTQNGTSVNIVEPEVTDAYALVGSFASTQKTKAVLSTQSIDLVLGPGHDGQTLQAEGLSASEMTEAQRAQLLALIRDRLGMLNADDVAAKMSAIEQNLDRTSFAWYGSTTAGGTAYWRVTGPTVIMEFSPQSMGGDATNHIHSMYRDPTDEYGAADVQ